jgi:hypothetical protein
VIVGHQTRSGRLVKAPAKFHDEVDYISISEILTEGAGIGGGFTYTSELIPMTYDEAMEKDPVGWGKAVDGEHDRMKEHVVFEAVPRNEVPKNAKILTSTWAMKNKADGTKRARLNATGYEQKVGEHYDETSISSPVVNEASIFICGFCLSWHARTWKLTACGGRDTANS